MSTSLALCPSCARHVRVTEKACPFCRGAFPEGLRSKPHGPVRRYVGKNATALAIASLLAAPGCGEGATATEKVLQEETGSTPSDAVTDSIDAAEVLSDTASDVGDEGGPFPVYK